MIAASRPTQRPPDARLLVLDAAGTVRHVPRHRVAQLFGRGDVIVVNDAATVPASLRGHHVGTGAGVELRLAVRTSIDARDPHRWTAVVFGEGDHRTPTEQRPLPPALEAGDTLVVGPLVARVEHVRRPRLVEISFDGSAAHVWEGIARHGRPVQYAHVPEPLATWDVWTAVAGPPVAVEPPSAGFVLDWALLRALSERGVEVVSLTHAAGLSSTGDPSLDALLPLDEPYHVPAATALVVQRAVRQGRRVVAIGTTVVRALESAARDGGRIHAGDGIATLRLSANVRPRVVTAILSGTHEPGTSHYALLEAFADPLHLARAASEMETLGYRTHEFGDSMLVERASVAEATRAVA